MGTVVALPGVVTAGAVPADPRCGFGARLRQLRCRHGFTQQELATELQALAWTEASLHVGVDRQMVSKWERGEKFPSASYRRLLCTLFRVTRRQMAGLLTLVEDEDQHQADVPEGTAITLPTVPVDAGQVTVTVTIPPGGVPPQVSVTYPASVGVAS